MALLNQLLWRYFALALVVVSASVLASQPPPRSGTLLVVNKLADSVSMIDIASQTIKATLPTGRGPHELAITDDGKWAVTTNYVGGNSLTVIDVANAKVVNTISLADYPKPHGIQFLADQNRVAVSSEGADSVVIVDVQAGRIVQAIGTEANVSHMVALPADSQRVYTTNMGSDSVSEVHLPSATVTRSLSMPATPEAIAVSKDGSQLWVGSNQDGLLSVFALDSMRQLAQFQDYILPYRILFSADQRFAVVPDLRQHSLDIYVVSSLTRKARISLPEQAGPKGVHFHPNDSTLFVSLYNLDKVLAIDIHSQQTLFELPTGDGPDGLGYSPLEMNL